MGIESIIFLIMISLFSFVFGLSAFGVDWAHKFLSYFATKEDRVDSLRGLRDVPIKNSDKWFYGCALFGLGIVAGIIAIIILNL